MDIIIFQLLYFIFSNSIVYSLWGEVSHHVEKRDGVNNTSASACNKQTLDSRHDHLFVCCERTLVAWTNQGLFRPCLIPVSVQLVLATLSTEALPRFEKRGMSNGEDFVRLCIQSHGMWGMGLNSTSIFISLPCCLWFTMVKPRFDEKWRFKIYYG